jgi:hypothetical protein
VNIKNALLAAAGLMACSIIGATVGAALYILLDEPETNDEDLGLTEDLMQSSWLEMDRVEL